MKYSGHQLFLLLVAFSFLVLVLPSSAHASTLLVRQGAYVGEGLGYGRSSWPIMTDILNSAFGGSANITTVSNFESATLTDYDAIWVDLGNFSSQPGSSLSANEISKITSFINTGKRVVLVGENDNWTTWDNSILSIVGGNMGVSSSGSISTTYSHQLTQSIATIQPIAGWTATGGTSLFFDAVATLWGTNQNVLVMLDSNAWEDTYIGRDDNRQFAQNVAHWIAPSSPSAGNGGSSQSDNDDALAFSPAEIIGKLQHISPNQAFRIKAQIQRSDAIKMVAVVNGKKYLMYDDGKHKDNAKGDFIYATDPIRLNKSADYTVITYFFNQVTRTKGKIFIK
ncbi:MAG: hypothetical protein K8Q97_01910 [Candidatus Andersenbacteria bacterium]|nr:hypothetical protein [Candidatus Andersenbacteria bacterium]